jgi:hypothetical protein
MTAVAAKAPLTWFISSSRGANERKRSRGSRLATAVARTETPSGISGSFGRREAMPWPRASPTALALAGERGRGSCGAQWARAGGDGAAGDAARSGMARMPGGRTGRQPERIYLRNLKVIELFSHSRKPSTGLLFGLAHAPQEGRSGRKLWLQTDTNRAASTRCCLQQN